MATVVAGPSNRQERVPGCCSRAIHRRNGATVVAGPSNRQEGGLDAVADHPTAEKGNKDAVKKNTMFSRYIIHTVAKQNVLFCFPFRLEMITDPKAAADVFRKQLLITEEQEQPLAFLLGISGKTWTNRIER